MKKLKKKNEQHNILGRYYKIIPLLGQTKTREEGDDVEKSLYRVYFLAKQEKKNAYAQVHQNSSKTKLYIKLSRL